MTCIAIYNVYVSWLVKKKKILFWKTNTPAVHIVGKNTDIHFPGQVNWLIIHKHLTSYMTQYKGIIHEYHAHTDREHIFI